MKGKWKTMIKAQKSVEWQKKSAKIAQNFHSSLFSLLFTMFVHFHLFDGSPAIAKEIWKKKDDVKSFSFCIILHYFHIFHFAAFFPSCVYFTFLSFFCCSCWELSVFHLKIITKQINEKLSKINNKFKRRIFFSFS